MRAMNKFQYDLVKYFLDNFKMTPKDLVKKWKKYGVNLELHEVFRVRLTVHYDVYKNDETPAEDVLLAMLGVKG